MPPSGSLPVRRLAFAGSWYSRDGEALAREVDAMVAVAGDAPPGARMGVSPHAGLRYSGHVAAWTYRALAAAAPRTVILVGPSHYAAFPACAMLDRGTVETPWGTLAIDDRVAARLRNETDLLAASRAEIHAREHSIELQLPFLGRLLPESAVVPILMGEQSRSVAFELGRALGVIARDPGVSIVASSDLSHYHDSSTARALDASVLDRLDACDGHGLMALLEHEPGHACGGGPIVAVLEAARSVGATAGGVLKYADSGDVSGDRSRVVGYASAAYGAPQ